MAVHASSRARGRVLQSAPACRPVKGILTILLLICFYSSLCWAQNEADHESSTWKASPRPEAAKSEHELAIERQEQSQRVLRVLPQFGVTSRQDAPALSSREKAHLFLKSAFDPASISVVGLQAALSQAEDEFPAYRQGASGYGKRFGAALADELDAGFWSNYAYPVLLKEDPRYFRRGEGSLRGRIAYSIKQEFVCHTDNGGRSFNFSNILGAFTSGAIANLYYPGNTLIRTIPASSTSPAIPVYQNERGLELTVSRASIAVGYGIIGGMFDEFWPDLQARLFRKHRDSKESSIPSDESQHTGPPAVEELR